MLASPQVYREREISFQMYFNDHPPPHVHATRGSGRGRTKAKFWLSPVELCSNTGFSPAELRHISDIVKARRGLLLREWHAVKTKNR